MRKVGGAMVVALGIGMLPGEGAAQEPEPPIVGSWVGALDTGAAQIPLVFHVMLDEDGTLQGTIDSPDQGVLGMALSAVGVAGDQITLEVAAFGASYAGTLSSGGDEITGTFSQGAADLPLVLAKTDEVAAALARPQEPKPPFPYETTDVTFGNDEAGIELAGTITRPSGSGPFPGVVLVSGSGPQDRDETLLGHKPFHVLADHLTRNGIAVLRFDDRGVGASGGEFATATSEDFTSDALAAVNFLRAQDGVDFDGVGIAGHSEGGLIAPMAANRSTSVGFIVMLAGPGVPGIDILLAQGRLINEAAGTPEVVTAMNERVQSGLADIVRAEPDPSAAEPEMRALLESEFASLPPDIREAAGAALGDDAIEATIAQINSPWFRFFLHHDPAIDLQRVTVPVLSLIGEKDLQVPHALNNPAIEAALASAGNADATVRSLPGLNHLFQEADTGSPTEYQRIEQTMSPVALDAVTDWILERFGS